MGVQPNVVGWSGMAQRPARIYVGMGGAPVVRQLAWRNWGGPRAQAVGKLDIYWPQPGPISGWHPTTYPVTVRLQDVVTRNGQASYREMADFYVNRRGAAKNCPSRSRCSPADPSRRGIRSSPPGRPGSRRPGPACAG